MHSPNSLRNSPTVVADRAFDVSYVWRNRVAGRSLGLSFSSQGRQTVLSRKGQALTAKNLGMKHSGPPLDEEGLAALSSRLGVTLPSSYKQFLLEHNRGVPTLGVFEIPEEGRDTVKQFFAVEGERHADLERKLRIFEGRLPEHALPIAEDPFGNLLLLFVDGSNQGAVAFWDHEREDDASGTTVLVSTLEAFLHSLRADDEE